MGVKCSDYSVDCSAYDFTALTATQTEPFREAAEAVSKKTLLLVCQCTYSRFFKVACLVLVLSRRADMQR